MDIILIIIALSIAGIIALAKNIKIEDKKVEKKEEKIIQSYKTLPHCLFYGPAGLGKTTLANVVQKECSKIYGQLTKFSIFTPSNLSSQEEVLALIKNIEYGDFVFIDEIHGLDLTIEESLYSIMQDFKYFYNGEVIQVPKFTLIGATTLAGKLSKPLRDRFTILIELEHIKEDDLVKISYDTTPPVSFDTYQGQESAKQILKMHIFSLNKNKINKIDHSIANELAKRSFGNPRIMKQLINHVIAFQTLAEKNISESHLTQLMELLGIDEHGLDRADRRVISYLGASPKPVGEDALARATGISKDDLISIVEVKLEHLGFLTRTPRGRELSEKCKNICKI